MELQESDTLFSAIESFLSIPTTPREQSAGASYTFWDGRTQITATEMNALKALVNGPLSVEALAAHLARDEESTREFLEGLLAVGIVERSGDNYANTMATTMYCKALVAGQQF